MKKTLMNYLNPFFGKDLELRVRLFHVLAITGVIICVIMTAISIAGQMWVSMLINLGAGLVSVFLLFYSARTRRYQLCYYLTIAVIFFILFPSLFFSGGGYQGGMPFFFVFAVVFTIYMLDGWRMLAITAAELVFYSLLCELARLRPELIIPFESEQAVVVDVIIGLVTVSISLGATMFVQVRMYRHQQDELEDARRQAEAASEAKSIFLANMSHEIRTPIHMILGLNEIIYRQSGSRQVRDYSEKISDTSKMLLSLVDSVLDVSKIESGKMELIPAAYDSANLVRTLILIGKSNCNEKGLRFRTDISAQLPPRLYGDLAHIRQIGANLLSNAAKYTKQGTVDLKISAAPSPQKNQILLQITVEDTGIGIEPAALPTLFDAFSRADLAAHRSIKGTGLGLKIVKELTGLMGGTVSVESSPGVGSRFRVELPQQVLEQPLQADEEKNVTFTAPQARILVVDDNEGNRMVMQKRLAPTGMTVDTASSGPDCLQQVSKAAYDLILMDYMMPDMDGLQTLQQLRESQQFHGPVIALTADATAETERKLLSGGFSAYLTKPIPWEKLRDTLLQFLPEELVTICMAAAETGEDRKLLAQKLGPFGISAEEALPFFENNPSRYRSVASIFLRHDPAEQEKVRLLWKARDWKALRYPIHALKGKAKNMGAGHLSDVCAHLEQLCQEGKAEELDSLMPYLFYLWQQCHQGLEALTEEDEASPQDSGSGNRDAEQLMQLLHEFRRKPSMECIRRMLAHEPSQTGRQQLQQMLALVEQIQFEQAEMICKAYQKDKKGEETP